MDHSQDDRERGGCLSLYLGIGLILGPIVVLLYLNLLSDRRVTLLIPGWFLVVQFALIILTFIFTYQTWHWKRWGLYGLYGTMIFGNLLSIGIGIGNPSRDLIQLVVQPLILYGLVRNKMDYFE